MSLWTRVKNMFTIKKFITCYIFLSPYISLQDDVEAIYISNYEFCKINQLKFKILNVTTTMLQKVHCMFIYII